MRSFAQNKPLMDAELDRLGEFLNRCKGGRAMNIEELDGFFAALIAGPETVPPSEYLPEVFGGSMSDTCKFKEIKEADDILGLLMRHWNTIAATLHKNEVYVPILLEDKTGLCHGNDWARGFMRGTEMRREGWAELITDEEHGGWMVPVLTVRGESVSEGMILEECSCGSKEEAGEWRHGHGNTKTTGTTGRILGGHCRSTALGGASFL